MAKVLENKNTGDLIKIADQHFSEVVRRQFADHSGMVKCCTCSKYLPWKQITCGHFMARRYNATRWDVLHAGPQCVECNGPGQGKPIEMALWIDKTYGKGTSEEMTFKANQNFHLDKWFLIDIINKLQKIKDGFNR